MSLQTIVVAEDEGAIRDLLAHHLEREGFRVVPAADGPAAVRKARDGADLLLLDVGLPVLDGFQVARTLRGERSTLPIVMLTSRTDEIDKVVAFELGADDFITKPFSPREVAGRIKAILRRAAPDSVRLARVYRFGRLEIDEAARAVRIDGAGVPLTRREFRLLLELASHPGVALSRDTLLERVWGASFEGEPRTVDVHVHRLRRLFERRWKLGKLITTIYRFGYRFDSIPA